MTTFLDTLLVGLVLTGFLLLGSGRFAALIRIGAWQGIIAGLLPLALHGGVTARLALVGAIVVGVKGFVFPRLLARALRESEMNREQRPFVGYAASLLFGVLALLGSFWLDSRLPLHLENGTGLLSPVAFLVILTGLFLIVARRTALNQAIGYITLENGIYVFGLAVAREFPVLIELGVLTDLFAAVFVMGIAIHRISREFDHIDAARLDALKG